MEKPGFVLVVLLGHLAILGCQDNDSSDDSDDDVSCLPKLADKCFSDIYNDISRYLTNKSAGPEELCSATLDGLQCSSSIIDGDCDDNDGSGNFDMWMNGLDAVYNSFCQPPFESLKLLTQDTKCWSLLNFVNCVEEETKLEHVIDLLKNKLDLNSCNSFLVSMSVCNAQATHSSASCKAPLRAVSEMLHTFFSATKCGLRCEGNSAHFARQLSLLAMLLALVSSVF